MNATNHLSTLNQAQQQAVTSLHKRLLVLAGAGSGKTKTLLQKIIYLIEEKGVSPSEILAITFTKNAANEMVDRLILTADSGREYEQILSSKQFNKEYKDRARLEHQRKYKWIEGLTVRTFHGFCYGLLRFYGVNEFDNQFRIIGDEKQNEETDIGKFAAPETSFEVYHKQLIELCEDTDFLLKLKRYILDYFVNKIQIDKEKRGILQREGKFYTSLNGTKVRSKSEQYIADWLYRHSIRFQYEPLLNISDFEFHPDFFIPDANLYLEHVSEKSHPLRNKEEQFEKGNLLLVKTYEPMTQNTALFNHMLDRVVKNRLPETYHKTVSLVYKEEMNGYHEQVKDFIVMVMRVTDMIKVENLNLDEIAARAIHDPHERVRDFYALCIPIIKKYITYCINKSYLDFNDMISRSISLLQNQEDIATKFRERYRYILVDEFQDVNNLQVELIKLLITPKTQLFCVGDDWQSIYGFRGSNVSYIIDFEQHFSPAEIIKLNLNYRSTHHIVGASNEVISHNKFKVDKVIHASKKSEHKIVVYSGNNEEENLAFCEKTVRGFLAEGYTHDDILFLYRRSKMYTPYFFRFKNENLRVQAKTIHAAKGLEAKIVFIIGLSDGSGGFPDIWLEDRIFQVIKKANHDLLLEEERRLFYVALTRAKEKLFLITEKGRESSFIKEIPQVYTVRNTVPLKPLAEELPVCHKCFSQLEKLWKVCPYCGVKVKVAT